jgi:hypothetical protein
MLNLIHSMRVVVCTLWCLWLAGTGRLYAQNDGWIKQFGAVNGGANCVAVDVDPATGNVYAIGAFAASTQNPFVIGTQSFTNSLAVYVVSYTADGTLRWVRTLPTSCTEVSPADISYADGHVFFTGSFTNGSLSLGSATVNTAGTSEDLFIGRVSASNGQPDWLLRGGGSRDDAGLAIKARNGIVMLGGYYNNSGVVAGFQLSSEGVNDDEGFIAFYSYSGSGNNAFSVGGTSGDFITAVDLADDGGYTYAGTTTSSSVDVAGNPFTMPASGRQQLFVRKVNTGGVGVWFKGYASTTGDIQSTKGRLSTSGSFLLAGTYTGTPVLGGSASLPTKAPGSTGTPFTNGFWVEISATTGNITRATALSGANTNVLLAIEQDPQTQDIYTVGTFGKAAQLGGKSLQSSAPVGVVVAQFPPSSLTANWAVTGEATTSSRISDVAIAPNVGVYGSILYEGNFTMLDKSLVFQSDGVEGALVKLRKTGAFTSLQCVTATPPTITTTGNPTPCTGETVVLTASTIPQGATSAGNATIA